MTDDLRKKELERFLAALGTEGAIDTMLCVKELEWATASEVAERMGTHVATAVKRLTGLHEVGILNRRTRKGRTRSAQEYSLKSSNIRLDIDLEDLDGYARKSYAPEYLSLLVNMAERFSKFSGKTFQEMAEKWRLDELDDGDESEIRDSILNVLDAETEEYGLLTVKSVAAASLDAIGFEGYDLPKKYFGAIK